VYLSALSVLFIVFLIAATTRDILDQEHDSILEYGSRSVFYVGFAYGLYRRQRWTKYAVGTIALFIAFVGFAHALLQALVGSTLDT